MRPAEAMKWLGQNWKWLLPMALLCLFFPITICIFSSVVLVTFLVVKSSAVYKQTVAAMQHNPKVVAALGSPIQPGLFVSGNINRRAGGTMVNLSIPLSGPLGRATAFAVAQKKEKQWQFTTLQVQCWTNDTHIDLLQT